MLYLRKVAVPNQPSELLIGQLFIALGDLAEGSQFLVADIGSVFFREQIFVHPILPNFREDDAAMHVFVQAFLEHASAQVVALPPHDFQDGLGEFVILDASLPCDLGEQGGFEGTPRHPEWFDHKL